MKKNPYLKQLLNKSEESTYEELLRSTSITQSKIFSKIRIADVISISKEKLTNDEYSFSLKGHFDFVITNEEKKPIFVVEFDGPSHSSLTQRVNDNKKMIICKKYDLPILRIHENHIIRGYRGKMSLLYWIIEVDLPPINQTKMI